METDLELEKSEAVARQYKRIARLIGYAGGAILAASIAIFALKVSNGELSPKPADWGIFGDYLGGAAGTAIALLTLVAVAMSLEVQAVELARANALVRAQANRAALQGFEAAFYNLLKRADEIARSVSAKGVLMVVGNGLPAYNDDEATGRKAFELMFKTVKHLARHQGEPEPLANPPISLDAALTAYAAAYRVYESELGPYYRTIYHLFKFIDRSSELSDSAKVQYANLARAQLSRYELALLYYNGLSPFGAEFKPLIESYGVLKHHNPADLLNAAHTGESEWELTAFMSEQERADYDALRTLE